MELNIRFDTKNNIEIINGNVFLIGTNFINFISSNIDTILNNKVISSLSVDNCKEIISKITTASKNTVIPEIININILIDLSNENMNMQQIKKDLTQVLNVYDKFKKLTEFCYFNDELKDMTPFQNYIYYLHKFKIQEVTLPKQIITSFGLKPKKASNKLLINDDVFIMLKENSPFLYFNYQCSNINDYMTASFLELIENNYFILKCKNCGKYFIAYNKINTLYCDRISPQNPAKNCKQYGKEIKWLERTKDEKDWYSLYRKIYQVFQKKAIRNPEHKESQKLFDDFRTESIKWKKAVKEGTKTEEEFIKWLQTFRNNK